MTEDLIGSASDALAQGRLDDAAAAMTRWSGGEPVFELRYEPLPVPVRVVEWRIGDGRAIISLRDDLPPLHPFIAHRLISMLPLLVRYHRVGPAGGAIYLNLGDCGVVPGLAYCAASDDQALIPDPWFVHSQGYQAIRKKFSEEPLAWESRRPVAFWRGQSSGLRAGRSWRTLPRIRLCEIAAWPETAHLFDVGVNRPFDVTEQEAAEIASAGLMREWVPASAFDQYRVHIDIDGNTNSWPGLFQKLLSGSPVLKVTSPGGFRQWYYGRLIPWENFVPVEPCMRDLVDKVQWLLRHVDTAREIGRRGAALAHGMTFESELQRAVETIDSALRGNSSNAATSAEVKPLVAGEMGGLWLREPDLEALERQGRANDAIAAIRKAIKLQAGNGAFHIALSDYLARQGRIEEAITAAREATVHGPGNPNYSRRLDALLLLKGGIEGADMSNREPALASGSRGDEIRASGELPKPVAAEPGNGPPRQSARGIPESNPEMSDLRFHIDRCDSATIAGWIDEGGAVEAIEITINGSWACTLAPTAFRADLKAAGVGDGRRAFGFSLAGRLRLGENVVAISRGGKLLSQRRVVFVAGTQIDSAEAHEISQTRWRGDEAAELLTWGRLMTGDSLWDLFQRHRRFRSEDHILEIGPGYGRLLRTALERKIPFASYTGLELSASRVGRLRDAFKSPNVKFLEGDIDTWSGDQKYDVVICSSTFEHLHPDCSTALKNIHLHLAPGGQVFIDFISRDVSSRAFEANGAYVRTYNREEIASLFSQTGYAIQTLEKCMLGAGQPGPVERLVVVALADSRPDVLP